jgi:cysteine desulfurase family protein (TIGR01976 family)
MSNAVRTRPSIDQIRQQFPSLKDGFVFFENAGGSQVPYMVADAIRDYMLTSYVQLGAGYEASRKATATVSEAHRFITEFVNGTEKGQVVLGPSSTQLIYMLAECYQRLLVPGDEIIIAETAHEANAGPWQRLERYGFVIRTWRVDRESFGLSLDNLKTLLNERTKIVAFPQVSNLLGQIEDVKAFTEVVHQAGARVVVDGVAYAPHRAIDVADWDVDWYVYSTYKVFGPHMGALYGKREAFAELTGPNHFFIPKDDPYKFELGGASHEGCAGLLALKPYWQMLAGTDEDVNYGVIKAAFDVVTDLELPVQKTLLDYLSGHPRIRVIGTTDSDRDRVVTIGFVHETMKPVDIVAAVDKSGIGIRYGHMYAYRLCKALGINTEAGVVRVSGAHYNTVEEAEKLIGVFDSIF